MRIFPDRLPLVANNVDFTYNNPAPNDRNGEAVRERPGKYDGNLEG